MGIGTSILFLELHARIDPSQGQAAESSNLAVRILKRVDECGNRVCGLRGDPIQGSGRPGSCLPVLVFERIGECRNRCLGLSSKGSQGNADRLAQSRIFVRQ